MMKNPSFLCSVLEPWELYLIVGLASDGDQAPNDSDVGDWMGIGNDTRMIQYRWDRREECKREGVRLSWSLGDRRRRSGMEKSGMTFMC